MIALLKKKYLNNFWGIRDAFQILRNVGESYFDKDFQQTACALTYRTLLAVVPFLAMVFAIARGFNVQNFLLEQLTEHFKSQSDFITYAHGFVDSYLEHTTDGVFIGVGIVALILTLYFLLNAVERSFDKIWDTEERSFSRKFTDYTSIMFWVPILMISAFGISVWIDSGIRTFFDLPNISTVVRVTLRVLNFVIEVVVFTLLMKYMPNTNVSLRYALFSGVVCSFSFELLQALFELSLYVSSYNAVYGSFAYLPLFLLWVQFSWLICLVGAQLAATAQRHYENKRVEQEQQSESEAEA
ncbi:MAG: YihY/virulence factor BrkB family protein [Muribaculaceae bacterium]